MVLNLSDLFFSVLFFLPISYEFTFLVVLAFAHSVEQFEYCQRKTYFCEFKSKVECWKFKNHTADVVTSLIFARRKQSRVALTT